MIAFELLKDKGVLVIEPKGALAADDFRAVARAVDPFIAEKGNLTGVLIKAPAFPGWDSFGALLEHMKFVREHHREIDRVAAVTDSAIMQIGPAIARHFALPEIRVFGSNEGDRAMAWLETGA